MLPHSVSTWIEGLLPVLLFLATSGWFLTWLSKLGPHSVSLSGQRARNESDGTNWYRFAIQNNEDVCLTGSRRLIVAINDDGKFLEGSKQKLFIGRNAVRARLEEGNRQLTLEFDELPAYDTWSIECRTDSLARALSLSVEEAGHEQPKPPAGERRDRDPTEKLRTLPAVLSHTRLTLRRDRDSAFEGGAFTPEGHWAVVATVLIGILPYFLYASYRRIDWWDLAVVLVLALFGVGLWLAMRRRAPSIAQGYWTGTTVEPEAAAAAAKGAGSSR